MSTLQYRFGPTTISKVENSHELRQALVDPWLKSETIIIKPNWTSNLLGDHTDAKTLRMFLETFDSKIVVTETYMIYRSMILLEEGMNLTVEGKEVNWKWFLKGDGWNWLAENPDWDWFKTSGHWDQLKKEDQAFLDKYGFTDLFKEFDVTYINATEEVWKNRIADPAEVKKTVEKQFSPVYTEEVYSTVPNKLYDLRGNTFISLAKLKCYATYTMKNIFGMIPDPIRASWHGLKNTKINKSILDVNKVYHSLFNVYGIFEALKTTGVTHPKGKYEGIYTGKYNIVENMNTIVFGRDLVSLDATINNLVDPRLRSRDRENRTIEIAEKEFGAYNRETVTEARIKAGNWLSQDTQ
jgi:uncharacterized protein (DUF362 family)